ncbi:VOC family protein [Microbispora catharanthi]|uniref:Glyoxalase/bleomycin resistance/extradiol dioxygenase family protein n=1 Tax=Microbispora catharanthi TaxID=1712871 RepID=A0A5N6BVR8_9ACTN|nr:VOC family protein [Microbispora catharanthi]KAB8184579.1 glyoxalase/bleomycin resistance/extradiol dioxygenase family protein [Microbispora catharanthi]
MDALYPRVLASRFAECFRFYDGLLTAVAGAHLVKGAEAGPYANWDRDKEAVLALLDREMLAKVTGVDLDGGRDGTMLVLTVDDVDRAAAVGAANGGRVVAPPSARPEWGPTCRTAHLRDPDGNLLELQSY